MRASARLQIVLDTNVWISGLIFGGNPEKIIRRFVDGDITVILSEEVLTELRNNIAKKFPLFLPNLPSLEALIRERAFIVQLGIQEINISRDSDDNKILETAVNGNARFIVTGDKDLLSLKHYKRIKILTPTEFLLLNEE